MKVIITDRARQDLFELYAFLAARDAAFAKTVLTRIDRRFQHLRDFPFIGRPRASLAPGLRSLLAGHHLIFYTVDNARILIVRVLDARMDIDEEFRR